MHPIRRSLLRSPLVVVLAAAAAAGCGEEGRPQAGEVEGTWALAEDSAGAVVLRVQGSEVDVFTENTIGDCFARADYDIIERRGVDFRITNGPDTVAIELQREEDVLRVTAFGRDAEYTAAAFDPEALPICQPPEPEADCALLPVLTVGSGVVDSLDAADPRTYLGTHYELYAIDFDAPIDVAVSMKSGDVDSYLSLHDSTGAFIQANDDRSSRTLDARLDLSLAAGCHILMATSAAPDEIGEFEVEVAVPTTNSALRRTR